MNKEQFIKERVKILVSKQNYSKAQATAIAAAQYNKEQQPAQQGGEKMYAQQALPKYYENNPAMFSTNYGQPLPQTPLPQPLAQPANPVIQSNQNYNIPPMFSTAYGQTQNVPNQGEKFGSGGYDKSQYSSPTNTEGLAEGYKYDASGNIVNSKPEVYTTNSVNIVNPNEGFGDPMYNLNRGLYNIGKGNTGRGIAGLGAFALGAARNGLLGYSTGKEDRRIEQEYNDKRFDRTPNYYAQQQGGSIENKMYQTGNSNVNAEDGEIVLQNGQIAEVYGKRHLNQNGKNIGGTDIQVQEGAKIISDADMPTQKITERDKTVIDDMYGIKVKKGITHADAVRELLKPLSIKKENSQLEDLAEKLKKANKIKDKDTKDLSILALQKEYSKIKEKVDTIEQERAERTNFVFENIQETKPKQGDGTQLFDKNGKVVEDTDKGVAQQGEYTYEKTRGMNLRKIKNIQSGVTNSKLEDGYYLYHDKIPTDPGFDYKKDREFVTEEAYTNIVQRSPAYQEYMRGFQQPKPQQTQQIASMQQGGDFESIAQKYNISPERARELISMQSGGEVPQQEAPDQMQQIYQDVAQIIQEGQDPIAFLMEKGATEEEAQQVVAQVEQQMQTQAEPRGEVPQEEMMAQQGGQKMYAQQGDNPFLQNSTLIKNFSQQPSGLTFLPQTPMKDNPNPIWKGDNQKKSGNYYEVWTPLVEQSLSDPEQAKKIDQWLSENKDTYSPNIQKQLEGLTGEARIAKIKTLATDGKPGLFHNAVLDALKATKPKEELKVLETITPTQQQDDAERVEARNRVTKYFANFQGYNSPQFAMQSYAKESYNPALDYAKKMSVEPFSQQMASKYGMQEAKLEQSGLSPQQLAGMRGNMFSSMLGAENDMNFKVSEYNANDQQRVDSANTQTMNRAQIMNSQYNQDYMNKSFQTLANQEESIRNQYRSNFLQEQANANKVINMNTANALNDQFAISPTGIIPLNNKAAELTQMTIPKSVYDKLTAEEVNAIKKKAGVSGMQLKVV